MVYKNRIIYLLLFQISCIQAAQRADAFLACQDQVVPKPPKNSLPIQPGVPVVPRWNGPLSKIQPRQLFPTDTVPNTATEDAPSQETFKPKYIYMCVTEETKQQVESMLKDPQSSCKVRMVKINGQEYYKIYDPSFRKDQRVPDQEAPSSPRKRKADGDHPDSPDSKAIKFSPHSVPVRVVVSLRGDQGAGGYSFGGKPGMAATLRREKNDSARRAARTRARAALNN